MTTKSTFSAESPAPRNWHCHVESGNLSLNKAVIRCRCTEEFRRVLDAGRHLPRAKERCV